MTYFLVLVLALSVVNACSAPITQKKTDDLNKDVSLKRAKNGESESDQMTKADKSKQLIICTNSTNSGAEGRAGWLTEKAKEARYNIRVVNMGGADVANRLIVEKNNMQADLVFGLNAIEYEKLKRRSWN